MGYSRRALNLRYLENARHMPDRTAARAAFEETRADYFKRHPHGALPVYLAIPKTHRMRQHYDAQFKPLYARPDPGEPLKNPARDKTFDPALIPQIKKAVEAGGGWARMKDLPGGENYIWGLIGEGVLKEDQGFVTFPEWVRKNPAPAPAIAAAKRLYRDFTGKAPHELTAVRFPPTPKAGLAFGQLSGLEYTSFRDGQPYRHRFKLKARPLLIASSDGRQLLIFGGRFAFTDRGIEDR